MCDFVLRRELPVYGSEDNTGRADTPLYEKKLAVEHIRAARSAMMLRSVASS